MQHHRNLNRSSPRTSRFALAAFAVMLPGFSAAPAMAQDFSIDWSTIDGGGQTFTSGAGFSLGGTIGQPGAGSFSAPLSGGDYALVGGFWSAARVSAECVACDANCDGSLNQFDISPFVQVLITQDGCSPCSGDISGDGSINQFDISGFINCLAP